MAALLVIFSFFWKDNFPCPPHARPPGPLIRKKFNILRRKKLINENYVEFYFSMGTVLVIFSFFWTDNFRPIFRLQSLAHTCMFKGLNIFYLNIISMKMIYYILFVFIILTYSMNTFGGNIPWKAQAVFVWCLLDKVKLEVARVTVKCNKRTIHVLSRARCKAINDCQIIIIID